MLLLYYFEYSPGERLPESEKLNTDLVVFRLIAAPFSIDPSILVIMILKLLLLIEEMEPCVNLLNFFSLRHSLFYGSNLSSSSFISSKESWLLLLLLSSGISSISFFSYNPSLNSLSSLYVSGLFSFLLIPFVQFVLLLDGFEREEEPLGIFTGEAPFNFRNGFVSAANHYAPLA